MLCAIAWDEFESDYDNAALTLTQASDQLQLLLGIEKPTDTFDIVGTLDPPTLTAPLSQIEQQALQSRPDYLAAFVSV